MASPTYSVTLHHLSSGARGAGLNYPDEVMMAVTEEQLAELLRALEELAGRLTIYEPSSPEIRIKTEREILVVRTRYRRLCFVGHETALRGEEHSVAYIMGAITGHTAPVTRPTLNPRLFERPPSAIPVRLAARGSQGGGFPDWIKIALLLVVSLACVGTGVWMLFRPARSLAPKFTLMSGTEAVSLLGRVAGQYQTGSEAGDRRLIIAPDGTLRIAKYGPEQTIAEEIIRTARGAMQDSKPALVTSDPYVMLINGADSVTLYGQIFKRVVR
ncbi:MAG TPA: hypothetical protein VIM71_00185 [Lacunisphaera sp.]